MGPSTDVLLGSGHEFSFTSLLFFTLLTYWLLKALFYLTRNSLDGPEGPGVPPGGDAKSGDHSHQHHNQQDQQQQQQPGPLGESSQAPIRSFIDPSQPGSGLDPRELRNASLARSAAFRVAATVRESVPRIHCLVEQLAGPGCPWPPPAPRQPGVDFVADLVHRTVLAERQRRGPEAGLGPRERAALETALLEEVAAVVAREQVEDFVRLAAEGRLHPGGGTGGPGQAPPHSTAH